MLRNPSFDIFPVDYTWQNLASVAPKLASKRWKVGELSCGWLRTPAPGRVTLGIPINSVNEGIINGINMDTLW